MPTAVAAVADFGADELLLDPDHGGLEPGAPQAATLHDRVGQMADRAVHSRCVEDGWQLGEHGLWCKHCNFETSLNAPLIVSAPWMNGEMRCDALVEFVESRDWQEVLDAQGRGER